MNHPRCEDLQIWRNEKLGMDKQILEELEAELDEHDKQLELARRQVEIDEEVIRLAEEAAIMSAEEASRPEEVWLPEQEEVEAMLEEQELDTEEWEVWD